MSAKEQGKQLNKAAKQGNTEVLARLLEAGADIDWQDDEMVSGLGLRVCVRCIKKRACALY